MYQYIAFYEESEAVKCRMHKRRVDILEKMLDGLNPQHYLAFCRLETIKLYSVFLFSFFFYFFVDNFSLNLQRFIRK